MPLLLTKRAHAKHIGKLKAAVPQGTRGAAVTLPPGTSGIDTAGSPNWKQVYAAGHRFAICYASYPTFFYRARGLRNPKDWTPAKVEDAVAAGLVVGFSLEQSSTTALSGWSAECQRLMESAQDLMDLLRVPATVPLLWNNDTDAYAETALQAVENSTRCAIFYNRRKHPLGLYGGRLVIKRCQDRGTVTYGWNANASSWNHTGAGTVHIQQFYPPVPVGGASCDRNKLVLPMQFWNPNAAPDIVHGHLVEDDMPIVTPILFYADQGQVGVTDDGTTFTCPTNGTVFMADGIRQTYRWVRESTLRDDQWASGQLGGNAEGGGDKVDNLLSMGCLVGEVPHA